ncbi:hypothetical protein BRADI_1g33463v3 [Brachypodium distachyon]|uniref:Uncharacterized protein n=1 Tax=Brachypodium distachyon TaxID=15368 RepID=A0A0Q3JHP6_BRADI|nr:hypothetical protein BRADI_1g33463v3 [Brachypodium distachyon]
MTHLLLGCAFTKSVLHAVLARAGALCCLPRPSEDLVDWLLAGARRLQGKVKAARSLINLSLWQIWKLWNACIFEGASPDVARLVEDIFVEADLCRAAGARALSQLAHLPLHARPPDFGPSSIPV